MKEMELVKEAARPGSATAVKHFGAGQSRFPKGRMGLLEAHAG